MLAPNASVTGGTPVTTGSVIIVITFSDSDAVDDTESTGVVACIATAGGAAGEAMDAGHSRRQPAGERRRVRRRTAGSVGGWRRTSKIPSAVRTAGTTKSRT